MLKSWIQKALVTITALAALTPLAAFAEEVDQPFAGEKINVGVVAGADEDVWKVVVEEAAKEGIEVELTVFTDYNTPNEALAAGDIDLNSFQHVGYLEDWNEANKEDLAVLGYTYVSPMAVYSEKIKSLDELEDGAVIGIPDDPTNGGRGILAFAIAGLIEVDETKGALVTPQDITDNPLNLEFKELDAANLAATLADVDASAINTNFAVDNGLTLDDAIFVDSDHPEELNETYKNVVAVRDADKDNALYKRLMEIYQSPTVEAAILEVSAGADRPAWDKKDEAAEAVDNEEDSAEEADESESAGE